MEDGYTGFQTRNMTIAKGNIVKNIIMYPHAQHSFPSKNIQLGPPKYQE